MPPEHPGAGPSPADLSRASRAASLQPTDGPSGDAVVDEALTTVQRATQKFLAADASHHDSADAGAGDVLAAGTAFHTALQARLDEAAG